MLSPFPSQRIRLPGPSVCIILIDNLMHTFKIGLNLGRLQSHPIWWCRKIGFLKCALSSSLIQFLSLGLSFLSLRFKPASPLVTQQLTPFPHPPARYAPLPSIAPRDTRADLTDRPQNPLGAVLSPRPARARSGARPSRIPMARNPFSITPHTPRF